MFYSHAILTSREHGVATVWLVATLGSRSSLKTVTRKKILDVDVNKACDTIQNPEAPMALRLQGNLLYGVARVYSQQCGYVLADAQAFRDKVRSVSMVIKELALDPETGRAKPDQLNLPDDPAFMPELNLDFDPSALDMPLETPRHSSLMSPPSLVSCRSSHLGEGEKEVEEPALELPSGDTSFGVGVRSFDLGLAAGLRSVGRSESRGPVRSILEEETGILDVGWEFDEHGNIVEMADALKSHAVAASGVDVPVSRVGTDSAISARVRQEHAEGLRVTAKEMDFDDGNLAFGEDEHVLPEARPFSPLQSVRRVKTTHPPVTTLSVQPVEGELSSTALSAPHRRARTAKTLAWDERPGLTNDELRQWDEGYLNNMRQAVDAKHPYKLVHQAKKNAEHWVIRLGIGGVGHGLGQDHAPGPLQMFSGMTVLAALTGRDLSITGTKHARSPSTTNSAEEEGRRMRAREEEGEQIGLGLTDQDLGLAAHDEGIFAGVDEMDIEVGRAAQEELPERRSSQMPWDTFSASRQGSIHRFGSAVERTISSIGGPNRGFELGAPSAHSRRASRLTTASPLQGRGPPVPLSQRISIISTPDQERLATESAPVEDDNDMLGDYLPPLKDDNEDFQLYGPAAAVDTQTAGQSQWAAAALDSESRNFLGFLDAQIQAKEPSREQEQDGDGVKLRRSATFEVLLPPTEHTRVVAARAFLHVLTLASKILVNVRQDAGFGNIEISIAVEV